jgi:hypothetical protein
MGSEPFEVWGCFSTFVVVFAAREKKFCYIFGRLTNSIQKPRNAPKVHPTQHLPERAGLCPGRRVPSRFFGSLDESDDMPASPDAASAWAGKNITEVRTGTEQHRRSITARKIANACKNIVRS